MAMAHKDLDQRVSSDEMGFKRIDEIVSQICIDPALVADLDDPAKLSTMAKGVVDNLIQSGQGRNIELAQDTVLGINLPKISASWQRSNPLAKQALTKLLNGIVRDLLGRATQSAQVNHLQIVLGQCHFVLEPATSAAIAAKSRQLTTPD
jgi:hypothetical protein